MEEELKKGIYQHTFAIIAKYKTIASLLKKLPSNPDLDGFLSHLRGVLTVYKQKYGTYRQIDLQECKVQYEPVRGLNQIEQVFNSQEQGFYSSYPNKEFGDNILQLFKETASDYDKLNGLLAKIPSKAV
jgi:hypothetical protein